MKKCLVAVALTLGILPLLFCAVVFFVSEDEVGVPHDALPPNTIVVDDPSFQARSIAAMLKLFADVLYTVVDMDEMQPQDFRKGANPKSLNPIFHPDLSMRESTVAGRRAVRFVPDFPREDALLFYVHGGGYVSGEPQTELNVVAGLASRLSMLTIAPTYRLAPENPFPAGINDVVAAYKEVAARYPDRRIALAAASAGGGLATGLVQRLFNQGHNLPDVMFLHAPHVDLTFSSASTAEREHRDALRPLQAPLIANAYAGKADPWDWQVSPLYGKFEGFPPVLILVGTEEVLFDDSLTMQAKLQAAGVDSRLEIWRGLFHVWTNIDPDDLPEAGKGLERAADFINHYLQPHAKPDMAGLLRD